MGLFDGCCRRYRQVMRRSGGRTHVVTDKNMRAMAYAVHAVLNESDGGASARSARDVSDMFGVGCAGHLLSVGRKNDRHGGEFVADIDHPQVMVDHFCAALDIPYADVSRIKELYSRLWSRHDDYRKPSTIAASLIALYNEDCDRAKHPKYPASLTIDNIADVCRVSKANVRKLVRHLQNASSRLAR
jgi:hypothetical protein